MDGWKVLMESSHSFLKNIDPLEMTRMKTPNVGSFSADQEYSFTEVWRNKRKSYTTSI